MNETALAKVDAFKGILNTKSVRAQIQNSLKENAGAFMSSMIDLYSGDPLLQSCDPQAVAMECLKAASLHLPIVKSLGFAYVVPYKNKPTFTIGYKGLIQLAQRSGQYRTINAGNVYDGEIVGVDKLSGMIDISGERSGDEVVGYFAYFKLLNGFEKLLYMTKPEIEAYAEKYSTSHNSNYSPWKTEFDKMAQKTVLRKLIGTYGVMTPDMQTAVVTDDTGATPQQEIEQKANRGGVVDINPDTGDVLNAEDLPSAEEAKPQPKKRPF